MSNHWTKDIAMMHDKFGVKKWMSERVANKEYKLLKRYLSFRLMMLHEELGETIQAAHVDDDATEVVDGIIELETNYFDNFFAYN